MYGGMQYVHLVCDIASHVCYLVCSSRTTIAIFLQCLAIQTKGMHMKSFKIDSTNTHQI